MGRRVLVLAIAAAGCGYATDVSDANDGTTTTGGVGSGGEVAISLVHARSGICAVKGRRVKCWGYSQDGAGHGLGTGEEIIGDDEVPADEPDVDIGAPFEAIWDGPCAYLGDGRLRCWGHTLWYEAIGDDETPAEASDSDLEFGVELVASHRAGNTLCALTESGGVRCVGGGSDGRRNGYGVGEPTGDDEVIAELPDLPLGGVATQVQVSTTHACALVEGGLVRCWGSGTFVGPGAEEHIGDDETPDSRPPVDVGGEVYVLGVDEHITCVGLESGGARCWGLWPEYGQLGVEEAKNHDGVLGDDEPITTYPPIDLDGRVREFGFGHQRVCALMEDATLRCWGGQEPEMGYPDLEGTPGRRNYAPGPAIQVGGPIHDVEVLFRATCVVLDEGIRCWGLNTDGTIGFGTSGWDTTYGDDEHPVEAPLIRVFD